MNKKQYYASKYVFIEAKNYPFISGRYYMILYISKGTCCLTINEDMIFCGTEDMILLKPGEKTVLHFRGGKYPLEVLSIKILPEYLTMLSGEGTNLEESFRFVPYRTTVVHSDSEVSMLIKNIALSLTNMQEDESRYGHLLYEKNLISMLLILTLRACINADKVHQSKNRKHILMDDIFIYIRNHLTEELTLERLEKEFFVSRYHILREFKRMTGQTPHAYIVKARLDLCRKQIEQGKSIREVYQLGGFGGYNHFFRAFKKEYGVTPREYYKGL